MRRLIAAGLLLAPAAASGADRAVAIGSFERLRVDGPIAVSVATGRSPGAHVSGDAALADRIDVSMMGDTLVVRMGGDGWGGTSAARADAAPVVTLTTPTLRSVAVNAGGQVSVARMSAPRLNLSINGAGSLAVAGAEADELTATVIGTGAMRLAGRAGRARLLTNGPGRVDAGALVASDLTVRLDGTGETQGNARYTAQVLTTGLGRVTVLGRPKCTVTARAGGPVVCGAGQ